MYSTENNNNIQPRNEQEQRMYENVDKFLNSVDEYFPLYNYIIIIIIIIILKMILVIIHQIIIIKNHPLLPLKTTIKLPMIQIKKRNKHV